MKRERKMLARLGRVLYWFAVIVAGLIAVWGVVAAVVSGQYIKAWIAIPIAAIIWGIGWAILYVLAGD